MGKSPARPVAKFKMCQARRWMAQGGMRVATAADRPDYESASSFGRSFKRVIGYAPSAARVGEMGGFRGTTSG
ncbi:AraC family transcriptional regulator [Roseateles sp.]|uniref:helix-turn-helix domain-containing protein n=1 Tax=Roseateles sp. TaxID=1971397 RepID=UPI00326340DF